MIWLIFLCYWYAEGCELGLTQLRHKDTLSLMRCVPTLAGQPDPCIVQTGGRMAVCQPYGQDYVCCGTQELLVQLLAGKIEGSPLTRWHYNAPTQHDFFVRSIKKNSVIIDSETKQHTTHAPIPSTNTQAPSNKGTNSGRKLIFPTQAPPMTVLTVLARPLMVAGNFTNSLRIAANVVALRDGDCTIIVNTGMTTQKTEIISNLGSARISSRDVKFVVTTSAFPQFIGNMNLFPNAQLVFEDHFVYKDNLIKGGFEENIQIEICSANTYLIATPGPTQHSVSVVARNVPSMGTVTVAGAVFLHDDTMQRPEDEFVWDTEELLKSRHRIICESDWIVPAHAAAFPVTQAMKRAARC